MIDHISIGARDFARSRRFYDAVLAPLGVSCLFTEGESAGYGESHPFFWVSATASPVPADPHSGLHICFSAQSRGAVEAFHAAALKAGGSDNGPPGLRPDYGPGYYAAFALDPDGYRIEAHFHAAS